MKQTTLYQALLDTGYKIDHHESDLYVEESPTTVAMCKAHGKHFTYFRSQIDGKIWLDVPFAYDPFWEKKEAL